MRRKNEFNDESRDEEFIRYKIPELAYGKIEIGPQQQSNFGKLKIT